MFVSSAFSTILPSGYTQLDYIETTSQEGINTGVVTGNSVLRIDYDFQFLGSDGTARPIFSEGTTFATVGTGILLGVRMNTSVSPNAYYFYNSEPGTSFNMFQPATTNRVSGSWVIDGSTDSNVITGDLQDNITSLQHFGNNLEWRQQPIIICQSKSSGDYNIRLYATKIYLDNVVVRNLIPAKRNTDGEIGMYDTVNDVFYTNSGTGSFTAGPEITLPEYIPLEYIEGNTVVSERNSINTGVIANNDVLSIDFDMQWINPTSSNGSVVFEVGNPNTAGNGIMFGGRNGHWFNILAGSSFNEFGTLNNDRIVANWTIDGTAGTSVISGDISKTDTSVSHFGNNVAWRSEPVKIGNKGNFKYYNIKIKLNDVVVRNLVPVKRKSDNVVGLYDLVGDTFYTNSGTGSFTAGPEVCAATVTILGAQFCLTENQPSGSYLTARYNNNKYYINLSVENDALNPKTITSESNNVLRIKVGNTTYNAHDTSVLE